MDFNSYQIRIIKTTPEFEALKYPWQDLLQTCETNTIFLTWEWLFTWWRNFNQGKRLFILTVWEHRQRLVGVAPFFSCHRHFGRSEKVSLHFLGSRQVAGDFLDFIIAPENQAAIYKVIFQYLEKLNWDFIELNDLSGFAKSYDYLKAWCLRRDYYWRLEKKEFCPYVPIQHDYPTYLKRLGKRTRRNIRNFERCLFREYQVTFEFTRDDSKKNRLLEKVFALHCLRQQKKQQFSPFLTAPVKAFHRELVSQFNQKGQVLFLQIRAEGQVKAALYLFDDQSRLYIFQGGYDPAYFRKTLNITTVMFARCIEFACREKRESVEFLRGMNDLKAHFTRQVRLNHTVFIARSKWGRYIGWQREMGRRVKLLIKKIIPIVLWEAMKRIIFQSRGKVKFLLPVYPD